MLTDIQRKLIRQNAHLGKPLDRNSPFCDGWHVSAADFQSRRRISTQRQTLRDELISDEGIRQYLKFRATKEEYLARALFAGRVLSPYTQDRPVLDFEEEFGQTVATASVDATRTGNGPLRIWIPLQTRCVLLWVDG